jgi:hypothetical protein
VSRGSAFLHIHDWVPRLCRQVLESRIMSRHFLFAVAIVAFVSGESSAFAQPRPSTVVELAAGALLFPDEGIVTEGFVGGAGRLYVSPRISIGPEVAWIHGDNHSHLMATGNVTIDLLRSDQTGAAPRVTPFVVVGAGVFQTREQFFNGPYTSHEGAFTAGGGVRAAAGSRMFIAAEARVGWEMHLRVNGVVGVRLGS